jgi:acyl-CoA reductase-like NAD-dependent aldehyde dehydrogenase
MADSQIAALRAAVADERLQNVRYRQDQLRKLHANLASLATQFVDALVEENGSQSQDAEHEVAQALTSCKAQFDTLNFEQSVADEYRVSRGLDFEHNRIALGIVHITPSHFTPFFTTVASLSAALAAGNCTLIKVRTLS